MPTITLTAKRQATFPAKTCEALQIGPGDLLELEPRVIDGRRAWILRPQLRARRTWVGRLKAATRQKDHAMDSVRASVAAGRKREKS